ncbi:hypothetical protein [Longitalea luteola]|uniref:hypothetical protein n=1 Tax=Longitalea luteola TaxID=2812563 RepID=UPI001A95D737|nr:hypothetical protein [Longitalea luteola]
MSTIQNEYIATEPVPKQPNGKGYSVTASGITAPVYTAWTFWQKLLFRIAFIFFICISIPNSAEWYKIVFHIDWTNLHYRDLYDIARFGSGINLFGNKLFGSTLLGYANWIITLIVAIVGALAWTWIVRRRKTERAEYNLLYYWLRVVVRYRAGIGIIGFGFTKLLPVQMPYPSLGLLNTNIGDLTAQKLYWLSIGIVPWYQIFAGVVEVLAGTLILFRRTTTIGSILLFSALADIVYVNFAYDGGVHVYSSYFVLLAAFLLVNDVPKLYQLLILEKYTVPVNFYPVFSRKWQQYARVGMKALTLVVFLGVFFYLQLINFLYDPYKQPSVAGLKQLRGNYAVSEFRINNKIIPYDPMDTIRWQEATFEKWTSLTFRVNKPLPLDLSNGGGDPQRDINRTFEIAGVGGGQRVFHYYADTVNNVLYLQDKYKEVPDRRNRASGVGGDGGTDRNLNTAGNKAATAKRDSKDTATDNFIPADAWKNIGNEVTKIDARAASTRRNREFAEAPKNEKRNRMILHYQTSDGSHVVLTGINENKDSIYVVLDRIDRRYALAESSLQAGNY